MATITHGAIYRPDSFVMMLRYCANLKAIRYESTSLNRIVADKSHRQIRYHTQRSCGLTVSLIIQHFEKNIHSMYQLIANVTIFPGHLTKIFARWGGGKGFDHGRAFDLKIN